MRIKRGSILMAGGLALLLAALCLTGYNLWDGKRAGRAAGQIAELAWDKSIWLMGK